MRKFIFVIACCMFGCADSEVGEKISDSISDTINYTNGVTVETMAKCTTCCRACSNYGTPSQYCWQIPCAIESE